MKKKSFEPKKKLKYEPPRVESEDIFEQSALACGKCLTTNTHQRACSISPTSS